MRLTLEVNGKYLYLCMTKRVKEEGNLAVKFFFLLFSGLQSGRTSDCTIHGDPALKLNFVIV